MECVANRVCPEGLVSYELKVRVKVKLHSIWTADGRLGAVC